MAKSGSASVLIGSALRLNSIGVFLNPKTYFLGLLDPDRERVHASLGAGFTTQFSIDNKDRQRGSDASDTPLPPERDCATARDLSTPLRAILKHRPRHLLQLLNLAVMTTQFRPSAGRAVEEQPARKEIRTLRQPLLS